MTARATGENGFVPSADGARWIAPGALTFDNAERALAGAQSLPLPARGIVDLAGLRTVDSSAVATLLALKRLAAGQHKEITFSDVPPALASLATLYGVEDLVGR